MTKSLPENSKGARENAIKKYFPYEERFLMLNKLEYFNKEK